ncbi:hypothetical protein [Clostridium estertheticum]|uniref:hypothetical protein n=1 Tax=Clostridium estertheticum TaxID=238834 RepID=UPI001C7D6C85|nr:hypothetical protein [Clostridium estertheticum]MBX4272031.1 hypothetical protein [Clostridium estertheticum]WLC82416.1 hypothetical protein KTC98_24125 [Clostridium estertheticum]
MSTVKSIELKQRRTCNNCRTISSDYSCTLGYIVGTEKINSYDKKPIEPCPKPITYDELISCSNNWRK